MMEVTERKMEMKVREYPLLRQDGPVERLQGPTPSTLI